MQSVSSQTSHAMDVDTNRKKPSKKGLAVNYLQSFCSNTSLHGLKYIGEPRRSFSERVCWLVSFSLCLGLCTALIVQVKQKWDSTPVIVTFAQTSTPVHMLPFPAVTLCSEVKVRRSFFPYADVFATLEDQRSQRQETQLQHASLVCDLKRYTEGNRTTTVEAVDFITEAAPPLDEMMTACYWKSNLRNCSQLFNPVLTDEGICYTFNNLDSPRLFSDAMFEHLHVKFPHNITVQGWTLEDGYPEDEGMDTFPRRTRSAGAKAGLRVDLQVNVEDVDGVCRYPVEGFKMFLHNPVEFPKVKTQFFRIPENRDMVVTVRPNVMTTSTKLMSYSPERRQCYFSTERQLHLFRFYTQGNCEVECLTNYTIQQCGCATFYMPRKRTTPLCGSGSIECSDKAEDTFYELDNGLASCRCLPACTEIKYDVELSHAGISWKKSIETGSSKNKIDSNKTFGRVFVYFKENQFIRSHRSELYGFTDFMANCGGLLGLFLGFSMLSLIECVYFMTMRLFCNLKNTGQIFQSQ